MVQESGRLIADIHNYRKCKLDCPKAMPKNNSPLKSWSTHEISVELVSSWRLSVLLISSARPSVELIS